MELKIPLDVDTTTKLSNMDTKCVKDEGIGDSTTGKNTQKVDDDADAESKDKIRSLLHLSEHARIISLPLIILLLLTLGVTMYFLLPVSESNDHEQQDVNKLRFDPIAKGDYKTATEMTMPTESPTTVKGIMQPTSSPTLGEEIPTTIIPYSYTLTDAPDERDNFFYGDPNRTALTDGFITEILLPGTVVAWKSSSMAVDSTHRIILNLEKAAEVSYVDVHGVVHSELGLHAPVSLRGLVWANQSRALKFTIDRIRTTGEGAWIHTLPLPTLGRGKAATSVTLDIGCPALDANTGEPQSCGITELVLF